MSGKLALLVVSVAALALPSAFAAEAALPRAQPQEGGGAAKDGASKHEEAVKPPEPAPAKEGEASAEKKYPAQDPSRGAVEGIVVLAGDPPELKPIEVPANHQDHAFCAAHVKDETLILSREKQLKNVVVSVAGYKPPEKAAPRALTLDNKNCTFVPHVQATTVGSTLVVTNNDPFLHNTHAYLGAAFNSAVAKGDEMTKKLPKPGWVFLSCDFHGWMKAHVWVFPHELFDVSDAGGKYRLVNIPPGEYEIEFWHEALEGRKQKVTIEAGKTVKLDLGLHAHKKK